jgi:hypothetical protein
MERITDAKSMLLRDKRAWVHCLCSLHTPIITTVGGIIAAVGIVFVTIVLALRDVC